MLGVYFLQQLILATIFFHFACQGHEEFGLFRLKKKGYLLKDSVSRVFKSQSQMVCAHHCAIDGQFKCKSFNFILDANVQKNCELNLRALSSTDNASLVLSAGALYFERINEDYPSTCTILKSNEPKTLSGYYKIQPNKDEPPFKAFCNMTDKNEIGVTVFSHDSEESTHVTGYEAKGSYRKVVSYDLSMEQIVNVVNSSRYCEQYIRWHCKGAGLYFQSSAGPDSWWVSRQGYKMLYWGGATPGSKNCACGMTNSCLDPARPCNCESVNYQWVEDSGLLVDKEYLPVSELRFGDTGHNSEEGYYTLGKLLCWH